MYAKNISEFILCRRDEQNAHTSTIDVKGAVEVHHLVLKASGGDGLLGLGPLSDEIGERLRLDRRPASKFNRVSAELDRPFDDMVVGLFVVKDVPQRELSNHGDLIILEVVVELTRCN